jgi:PAS domain S-box-containing protein
MIRTLVSGRWFIPAILLGAVAILAGCTWFSYQNVRTFSQSSQWVENSRAVLTTVERIAADLAMAESAGRGYWISGDESYRQKFEAALANVAKRQTVLQQLTPDATDQQQRIDRLEDLTTEATEQLRLFITFRQAIEGDAEIDSQMLASTTSMMIPVLEQVDGIRAAEDRQLNRRSQQYLIRYRQTVISLLASFLIGMTIILGLYYLLRRHWSLQQRSAAESAQHVREKNALSQYNERLLESTGEGIYGIDRQGLCTFINRAGAILLGGRREDFLGREMHQLVHHTRADGQPYAREDCPIYLASRNAAGCQVEDEVFWRLDGTSYPVEYSSFPIRDHETVEGAVVTFKDITLRLKERAELEEAKESAERANEFKSQFLANMSHELRTPLNAVIMYSELLAEEAEDQHMEQFIPDLNRISTAGKHLLQLVNGVLDLSKIEAGKMEVYHESIEIRPLVESVVDTIKPLVEKNDNRLEVEIDQRAKSLVGDVTKLRQILFNLLNNAGKFTEGGLIRLTIQRTDGDDGTRIVVSDSGIGMTEAQVSNLFQPFVQADATTTRKFGGTGLGLAISRRFIELMGGSIEVHSELAAGTTFTIQFPDVATAVDSAPSEQHRVASQSDAIQPAETTAAGNGHRAAATAGETVLVIDDDVSVRDILTRVLVNEGIRCITAADGEEGLRLARRHHPGVILLDVMMPKIDGWSVLLRLKEDEQLADIPVIMQSIGDERDLGFVLGASEYLTKPIDRIKLVSLLRRYLNEESSSILVVDDDETIRRAIRRTLQRQGWDVREASNGADALRLIAELPPALILLDLMMPVMDGLEFLEHLRQDKGSAEIPVVVLTAKELSERDRQQLNVGVQRILTKGTASRQRLLDEVRRAVNALRSDRPNSADRDASSNFVATTVSPSPADRESK